ncbi:hypothetical protein NZK33_16385 [Cyanobium sp. FGCU-6]|nr:hypothetical protein [Cyanobium sp. FGCU6]
MVKHGLRQLLLRELKEALPAFLFFLVLFHLIALTKAVTEAHGGLTPLRATVATAGALIVAKTIVLLEALPIAWLFPARRILQILWQAVLFTLAAVLFRFVEEFIPRLVRTGNLPEALQAMGSEITWPLFAVLALWIFAGVLLYCLVVELARAAGREKVRALLLGPGRRFRS